MRKALLSMQMNQNNQDAEFEKRDGDGPNQEDRENLYASSNPPHSFIAIEGYHFVQQI
jgi:hypothetical protein